MIEIFMLLLQLMKKHVITAYEPDTDLWEANFKTRKKTWAFDVHCANQRCPTVNRNWPSGSIEVLSSLKTFQQWFVRSAEKLHLIWRQRKSRTILPILRLSEEWHWNSANILPPELAWCELKLWKSKLHLQLLRSPIARKFSPNLRSSDWSKFPQSGT